MAEEREEQIASNPKGETDQGVSRSIKNVAALIGIFAALAGIYVSIQGLRDKSFADQQAAEINLEGERTKLAIAKIQQAAQDQNIEAQRKLHTADNELEFKKHQLDIQTQVKAAKDQGLRSDKEHLTESISQIFSNDAGAEGDLAVLFNYIGGDAENVEIIENAVMARLENPRSIEEIDLGFRLLEKIGLKAIDVTAQTNRSARGKYDSMVLAKFVARKSQTGDEEFKALPDSRRIDIWEEDVAKQTPLDRSYVYATINKMRMAGITETAVKIIPDNPNRPSQFDMVIAVIERSNLTIMSQLNQWKPGDDSVDLSRTYLEANLLSSDVWVKPHLVKGIDNPISIGVEDAYLGLDSLFATPRYVFPSYMKSKFGWAYSSKNDMSPNGCVFKRIPQLLK